MRSVEFPSFPPPDEDDDEESEEVVVGVVLLKLFFFRPFLSSQLYKKERKQQQYAINYFFIVSNICLLRLEWSGWTCLVLLLWLVLLCTYIDQTDHKKKRGTRMQ